VAISGQFSVVKIHPKASGLMFSRWVSSLGFFPVSCFHSLHPKAIFGKSGMILDFLSADT
jgi:hypothetical protein